MIFLLQVVINRSRVYDLESHGSRWHTRLQTCIVYCYHICMNQSGNLGSHAAFPSPLHELCYREQLRGKQLKITASWFKVAYMHAGLQASLPPPLLLNYVIG